MKKFSELGIQVDAGDKMFDCPQVSICELVNCEIVIVDFIAGVNTKHGEDRMIILIEMNGVRKKIFTNSKTMKGAVMSVCESDFPFITVIRSIKTTNGTIYKMT